MSFDVVIIGAGPAAWAAAIFLARAGVKTLVVGKDEESGLADAAEVWNYPGFPESVSGRVLLDYFVEQGKKQGVVFEHAEVTHMEEVKTQSANAKTNGGRFLVKTAELKEFWGNNLVLAHGANYIKANLPGEKEFAGKGVHYCALCDGPLHKGKQVLVLGNGNAAAEEAVELAAYVGSVVIVAHSPQTNFSPAYAELLESKNIEVVLTRAKGIEDTADRDRADTLVLTDGTKRSFDALFISLGVASSQAFAQKLGLELAGDFVKVDAQMRTSVAGVWAAGIARGGVNQIVKSVGDGGVAAIDIIKTVKGLPNYIDHT